MISEFLIVCGPLPFTGLKKFIPLSSRRRRRRISYTATITCPVGYRRRDNCRILQWDRLSKYLWRPSSCQSTPCIPPGRPRSSQRWRSPRRTWIPAPPPAWSPSCGWSSRGRWRCGTRNRSWRCLAGISKFEFFSFANSNVGCGRFLLLSWIAGSVTSEINCVLATLYCIFLEGIIISTLYLSANFNAVQSITHHLLAAEGGDLLHGSVQPPGIWWSMEMAIY